MKNRFVLRKVYLASLSTACVSTLLSILGLSLILNYGGSQVIKSDPETIFLAIRTGQLSLAQFAVTFPSILALVNIALFIWLYFTDNQSRKLVWYSIIWIFFSILYSTMNYASASGIAIPDLVFYPIMLLTWLTKTITIRVLWLDMKSKKGQ